MSHDLLLQLSLVILILPLVSFLIIIFNQKKLGKAAGVIGTVILGIDLALAAVVAYGKLVTFSEEALIQWKFSWFSLGNRTIDLGVGVDNLAAAMLIVVTLISFLVHLFSTEYMHDDKRYPRFFAYLGIFTFSMLGIVIANNLLNMYIFWELVGLSSYLLIGFWYEKDSASNASKKAFITNRVGDLGFFAGIMIAFFAFNTFMFDEIFEQIRNGALPFESGTILTAMGILLFAGAIGKSAQFPLHVWLPDAMEGPTPVSALIHAATMVAAGVFMTAKIFPIFTADALTFVAYTGAFTAFMAATIGITQNDFKRVLAYSTVSQLGFMIMALGVGAYTYGFFHLVTHAWFKACLFLASGSVIHAMHHAMHQMHDHHTDPQDIRNMGGLRKTMPKTYLTFLLATIAIAGVPLTSGFLSKDGILAGTLAFGNLSGHWLIPVMAFSAAGMTAFYMFRLTIVSFHGEAKTEVAAKTHENKTQIVLPLVVLAILSIWIFYSFNPIDASSGWFAKAFKPVATVVPAELQFDFITPLESHGAEHGGHSVLNKFEEELHHQHYTAMFLSLAIAGFGIFLAFMFYQYKKINPEKVANAIKPLYLLSYNKWYIDEIYEKTFIGGTLLFSKLMYWIDSKIFDGIVNGMGYLWRGLGTFTGKFDNGVVDGLVNLSGGMVGFSGSVLRKLQTGRVQTYLLLSIIGLIVLIWWVV
ncbi:MAG: NADH-quinone oxidoreductase subunit L [Candidatus Kapabacteria bacterium]|nr:NADH-quinone oxidoreductase subunit L [Ignavibacteriota bacterium]MCW5885590.1 NADH-quinone oxidoreductase subunit L [Candidatus Kapabacteria bacterium]